MERARRKRYLYIAAAVLVSLVISICVRQFIVKAYKIPSDTMTPTLLAGDRILVSKSSYGIQRPTDCEYRFDIDPVTCYSAKTLIDLSKPQRGDVIVSATRKMRTNTSSSA